MAFLSLAHIQSGDYCGEDSSVQFRGNFAQSDCSIVIQEVEERHDGLWKCVAAGGEEFVDNIDIVLGEKLAIGQDS